MNAVAQVNTPKMHVENVARTGEDDERLEMSSVEDASKRLKYENQKIGHCSLNKIEEHEIQDFYIYTIVDCNTNGT